MRTDSHKSDFIDGAKPFDSVGFPHDSLGQNYPQHYPPPDEALGDPLTVGEVAKLLGCSDWTVRHGHVPKGLPHLRSGPMSKLVFFRNQVVRWVLHQQKKGGR